jgi:hypothetical protein
MIRVNWQELQEREKGKLIFRAIAAALQMKLRTEI